jgi:thymidylate synthase (FAD)
LYAKIQDHFDAAQNLYKELLEADVAKECARFVLPLAVPTKIYMTGSCRSWIHYINLREKNGTQKEHMEIANACKKVFVEQFPSVSEALEWV